MNIQKEILKVAKMISAIEVKAIEFETEEAMKNYLKEHPDADTSKHTVVEKKDDGGAKEDSGSSSVSPEIDKAIGDAVKEVTGKPPSSVVPESIKNKIPEMLGGDTSEVIDDALTDDVINSDQSAEDIANDLVNSEESDLGGIASLISQEAMNEVMDLGKSIDIAKEVMQTDVKDMVVKAINEKRSGK
jgi:hypothetical protein